VSDQVRVPGLMLAGRAEWRRLGSRAGTRIKRMPYLNRWLILAGLIGVVAGLGAVVFYATLAFATHLFLGRLAGYQPPAPAGEGGAAGSAHYLRAWAIPLVVALGALLSGFLVFSWAPEAEGHGTDAAIDAVHYNPRGIRLRAVVIKMAASALTIGSGGSGGREGPTAQISAGFGSLLARLADLSPEDGRIAVSVGIGSGIGAIFGAPLGGAVLAADIIYREDFEYVALVPGLFASVVAYAIFGAVNGYQPLFRIPGGYHFDQPWQLLWFAVLGLLAGGIGLLYAKGFYGSVRLFSRLPFSRKLRPALGGVVVGLLALAVPEVLGTGYGWIQLGLSDRLAHVPLYLILLLPFARILATALSIGSGGSGGVFGPGMVIGAFTGLALWRLLEPIAPGVGHDPAPFVVVGMMAVFGGISRAPLAVMIMVAEMTGSVAIVAPALVAMAISVYIVGRRDDSIYRSQLRSREDSQASRFRSGMPLLASLQVRQVAKPPTVVLHQDSAGEEALRALQEAGVPGAPLVDAHGLYLGTVGRPELARALEDDPQISVNAVLDATTATVPESARLSVALEALTHAGGRWVTVTGESRRVVGVIAVSDVVRGYRQALRTNLARMSQVTPTVVTVEEAIGTDSALAGKALREAGLPPGAIVISVQRGQNVLLATGSTGLAVGDILSVLAAPDTEAAVRAAILGATGPPPPMVERGSQMV
jgi:CIC family chloride channel protein